jgi:hypothetical protein
MSTRAAACRQRAEDRDRAASRVSDPQVQATYRDMARRWREMADHAEAIEKALAARPLGRRFSRWTFAPEQGEGGKPCQWHDFEIIPISRKSISIAVTLNARKGIAQRASKIAWQTRPQAQGMSLWTHP